MAILVPHMKILKSKFPSTLISKFTVCVVSTSKKTLQKSMIICKIHDNLLGHFGPLIWVKLLYLWQSVNNRNVFCNETWYKCRQIHTTTRMNSTKVQTLSGGANTGMLIYIETSPLGYNESMRKITVEIQAQPQRMAREACCTTLACISGSV